MRILIECSHISFGQQLTGIPRVVLKYIECGYDFTRETGVIVCPVVVTSEGVFVVRPLPGSNPSKQALRMSGLGSAKLDKPSILDRTAHYGSNVAGSLASLIEALLPIEPVRSTIKWASDGRAKAAALLARRDLDVVKIKPSKGDIIFSPSYWHDVDPELFKAVRASGAKVATLVHDLLPIYFDKFYDAPWKYQFKENAKAALAYSDWIYCVSDYTRKGLVELAARSRIDPPPMSTTHNAFEPLVSPKIIAALDGDRPRSRNAAELDLLEDKRPYIMVGSVEPKKGHLPTLRTFEALWSAGYSRPLFFIGRKGWKEKEVVEAIETSPFKDKLLFWCSGFDDLDLYYAYQNAKGLIFSSISEGFGIPMIEAATYRCPVIVYDTKIGREVMGKYGQYFRDGRGLAELLLRLEDDSPHAEAVQNLQDFAWPSWEKVAPKLLRHLIEVVNGRAERVQVLY